VTEYELFICWDFMESIEVTGRVCIVSSCVLLSTGLGVERDVSLEPGLFEWLGWYLAGVPRFLSPQEFHDAGLPVCLTYSPIWPLTRYNVQETTEQFYDRSYQVTREILKRHETEGMHASLLYCLNHAHHMPVTLWKISEFFAVKWTIVHTVCDPMTSVHSVNHIYSNYIQSGIVSCKQAVHIAAMSLKNGLTSLAQSDKQLDVPRDANGRVKINEPNTVRDSILTSLNIEKYLAHLCQRKHSMFAQRWDNIHLTAKIRYCLCEFDLFVTSFANSAIVCTYDDKCRSRLVLWRCCV